MDPRFGKNGSLPVNIGPVNALPKDRFGNVISKGMHVIYKPQVDLVFEVVDVKPILDPRAPTGLVQMVLTVTFPFSAPANQPILQMIGIGQRAPVENGEATDEDQPVKVTEN